MNPLIYFAFWLTALLVAGLGVRLVLRRVDRLINYTQQTRNLAIETNRLLARAIELETEKQATRQSGRDLLRERLKERLAVATAERKAKQG
jgi:hypothetical protein